jgi:hypothetical protein
MAMAMAIGSSLAKILLRHAASLLSPTCFPRRINFRAMILFSRDRALVEFSSRLGGGRPLPPDGPGGTPYLSYM